MRTHADKHPVITNRSAAAAASRTSREPAVPFADDRPEVAAQRQLQEVANESQVRQRLAYPGLSLRRSAARSDAAAVFEPATGRRDTKVATVPSVTQFAIPIPNADMEFPLALGPCAAAGLHSGYGFERHSRRRWKPWPVTEVSGRPYNTASSAFSEQRRAGFQPRGRCPQRAALRRSGADRVFKQDEI
jgi:hypothetical protein